MRIGGIGGMVLSKLGAVPQQIPPAIFTPRWKKARLMLPNGLALTTMKGWA